MINSRTVWWLSIAAVVTAATGPVLGNTAFAQGWQLPWSTPEVQRERPRPRPQPAPRQPDYGQSFGQPYGNRSPICLQLEQRLAQSANQGAGTANAEAQMREALRDAQRRFRRAERELDRRDCYENFLFTRSLRPSRRCRALDRDLRQAQSEIARVTDDLRRLENRGDRSYQDEIIRALARNNCGGVYQREARRRDPWRNFWQDGESDGPVRGNTFAGLPFATYRTLCVRLCDGYYFPVSFSTLPTHFPRDAEACQAKCAAPTELYFHQNPGGSVDQMVSRSSQEPYNTLKTAFRYRKEFVPGCSCKQGEYLPKDARGRPGQNADQAPAGQAVGQQQDKLSPVR